MSFSPNKNPNQSMSNPNRLGNSINETRQQLQNLGFHPSLIENAIQATNFGTVDQCFEYISSIQESYSNNSPYPRHQFSDPNQRESRFRQQAYERRREAFMQIKQQRQQEAQKRRNDYEDLRRQKMSERAERENRKTTKNDQIEKTPQKPPPTADFCENNVCNIDLSGGKDGSSYAVICPLGQSAVQPIEQCRRLDTFEGKTIAIVGGSFMASVTHPELRRLITKEYPTAKVYVLSEIGSAGVFPGPSIRRKSVELFQSKLKELKVDAVISGNGGCGLCTPKETGSSIAAEYAGIPSVTIAAPGFADQVVETARNNGLSVARVAVYPGAFASHSREELISNTDKILWPQIKEALTKPISESEKSNASKITSSSSLRDPRQVVFCGTIDEVNRYFNEMNWSDGLPIIPPTIERINEFLKFSGMSFDTHIAVLPIAHRKTLAIHVAACGVMSGCRPEFMPILIAMTKALGHPDFRRTLSSTHAWNPYCWINGPIARQIGIDFGQGEISEEANVSIGRFMNLALKNLSGYYVKQDRMGTFGYIMPWCLVEDEEACNRVGWFPYHVQQGFKQNDNTITISSALMWGNNMPPSSNDPEKIMKLISWDITERCQFALGSGKQFVNRTVLITEPVASLLSTKYQSKEILEQTLIDESRRPLHERAFANYYANPGSSQDTQRVAFSRFEDMIARNEGAEITQIPEWYAKPEKSKESKIMTIPVMKKGMTAFILTGDRARNKVQIMPGGGCATVQIELPENWNDLMQEIGYQPLEKFIIH